MTNTRVPTKTLRRGEITLSISAPDWSNVLLVASKSGWLPERPSYFFIASGFEVRDSEALALAHAIEGVWAKANEDPFSPTLDSSLDLAQLMDVGSFCLGGGFTVE